MFPIKLWTFSLWRESFPSKQKPSELFPPMQWKCPNLLRLVPFFSSYGDTFFCKQNNGSLSLCCLTTLVKAFIANTRGLIILVILQGSSLQIFTWSVQSAAWTHTQREGMDLLEYQAMPFLRDVAHDGVLCTFINRSSPGRGKWRGPSGRRHGQNHTLLGHSPP